MALDPQSSWIQWSATTVIAAFTALIGLFVSFGRDAHKIYREKVDALEQKQATFSEKYLTREEFRDEMNRWRGDVETRSLQMHNHNATLLTGIGDRIEDLKDGMDQRMSELHQDMKDVHKRIDEGKK
jgi:hypothetical protein